MTTIDKDTLLLKTKKDVETFMDKYKIHECYKTKIIQFINECFGAESGSDEKKSESDEKKSSQPPSQLSKRRSTLPTLSPSSPRLSLPNLIVQRKSMASLPLSDTDTDSDSDSDYKVDTRYYSATEILNGLWIDILTTFDLVVLDEGDVSDWGNIKHWYEYDWSNMTEEENTKNGLNIVFWIFRQIAVNFLLYFFAVLFPGFTFKMTAMGSVSVTSDYDISISSDKSAEFTRIFNFFFQSFGGTKTSGIIFDTNIYAHPIVEDIEGKESNNCYKYHQVRCNFLKVPKFSELFLETSDRIAAILMYYKYFGRTKKKVDLEYRTYEFLLRNFPELTAYSEKVYGEYKRRHGFEDGQVTDLTYQNTMNERYEDIATNIQDIKLNMKEMCKTVNRSGEEKIFVYNESRYTMGQGIVLLLNKMTELQFFGNETLLSMSAFLHVVVYLQEMCTDDVFSGCRKTIINKSNAKFIYLNSFIENLCFMTTHFKDIKLKGLKKIMKYLYRTCDALVEYLKNVKKIPTQELINIYKITKQWQQNKNKGEPEKMTENVEQLEKFMNEKQMNSSKSGVQSNKIKFQVDFLMIVFQKNLLAISEKKPRLHQFFYPHYLKTRLIDNVDGGKKKKKKSKVIRKKKKVIRKNKKKKVRKHQGISQTGGNIGKLKKGFRYSGKKLKSGLPQIIKCKQTNKSKK